MKCPKCKQEVTGKFCSFCGTLLQPDHTDAITNSRRTSSGKADRSADLDKDFDFTIDYDTSFYTNSDYGAANKSDSDYTAPSAAEPESDIAANSLGEKLSGLSGIFGKSSSVPDKQPNSMNQKTVTQETTVQKKKKKKKKGRVSGVVSGTLSTAGSITTGSVRTIWKIVMAAIQWITAAVMLLITWKLFQGLWAQRTALGSLTGFIQERNMNQAAYLAVSLCLIAFGILQTLWIISRKKMPDNGRVRRIDMGRGIFGFLVFLLLALIAQYINPIIPEHPYPLLGIKQVLSVVNGLGKAFLTLNVTGIVLCIVRKVGTR